jgi:hypothetical protein
VTIGLVLPLAFTETPDKLKRDEVPEGHRLRELLAETRKSGAATALTLKRLNPESVEELAGQAMPGGETLGPRLSDETEGWPLFLTEYLAAVEKGELDLGDDTWTLPGGVQDLLKVVVRFRRARGEERQQIKWVAYAVTLFAFAVVVVSVWPSLDGSIVGSALFLDICTDDKQCQA